MSQNIWGNVAKYSGKYCKTFQRVSSDVPGNVCFNQGDEEAEPVQAQNIAWNLKPQADKQSSS